MLPPGTEGATGQGTDGGLPADGQKQAPMGPAGSESPRKQVLPPQHLKRGPQPRLTP